jgi:hypothetical protein
MRPWPESKQFCSTEYLPKRKTQAQKTRSSGENKTSRLGQNEFDTVRLQLFAILIASQALFGWALVIWQGMPPTQRLFGAPSISRAALRATKSRWFRTATITRSDRRTTTCCVDKPLDFKGAYDCNGSRAGVYDRTSTDRCASHTGLSQLYDGYVLFSRQPPRTAGRRLTARSGHTVGRKIAAPMTGFKVQPPSIEKRSNAPSFQSSR